MIGVCVGVFVGAAVGVEVAVAVAVSVGDKMIAPAIWLKKGSAASGLGRGLKSANAMIAGKRIQ